MFSSSLARRRLPIIGVTVAQEQEQNGLSASPMVVSYLLALLEAGAAPVLISSALEEKDWLTAYARLDGILFSGGGDLALPCYGNSNQPRLEQTDTQRDALEMTLCRAAIRDRKPLLGICRGLQVLNVCQEGTLYADLVEEYKHQVGHNYPVSAWPPDHPAHDVEVATGSQLAQILGMKRLTVNSRHHQGVRELGKRLRPCGWAPDGLVEALEMEDHPFALAVQWHPESLSGQVSSQRLFRAFVQACAEYTADQEQVP